MDRIVKLRNELKKKKPDFIRQDAHQKAKLRGKIWRRPTGSDSKIRRNLRGYRSGVTKGYKSPALARGLSRDGKRFVIVANVKGLLGLNPTTECIIISAGVGIKKKVEIVKAANAAKLNIFNLKDSAGFVDKIEKQIADKKDVKSAHQKEKEKKEKEKQEAAKKKEDEKKKESADEKKKDSSESTLDDIAEDDKKKEEEKKEMDKVLTRKSGVGQQ
jgi:large subunit ribosomal protein L32e